LAGRRILIVEDEYYLADDLEQTLRGLGAEIAGQSAKSARLCISSPEKAPSTAPCSTSIFAMN
jgi:hypothetical protein